ncbi:hypothetical protein [Anabaena sp. CCY 0017]|uniref:hypothetical protein n=1 Tax=Anabaena sp. CCY 0017 TaxID=3103866 RepID=UPI0039C6F926
MQVFYDGNAECFNTFKYQPLSYQMQFLSLIPNSIVDVDSDGQSPASGDRYL